MQSLDTYGSAVLSVTPTNGQGIPSGNPAYSQKAGQRLLVSSGPLIKGDFKSPTPWFYEVVRGDATIHGKLIYLNQSWYPGNGYIEEGSGIGSTGVIHPHDSFLYRASAPDPYQKCYDKLLAKIRSDVDLSVDVYQGQQLVQSLQKFGRLLRSPLRTFAETCASLFKKRKWRRSSGFIAENWLEWQYGIKPTMSTIFDITSDMFGHVSEPGGLYKAVARHSYVVITDETTGARNVFSVMPVRIKSSDSRRCRMVAIYSIDDITANTLSQFSSLNPVSFAYENIPLSFVLDWVYDVGGFLRTLETTLMTGLVFHSSYVSETRKRTTNIELRPWSSGGVRYVPTATAQQEHVKFSRTVHSSFPTIRAPVFNIALGSERLFSLASLLRGALNNPSTSTRR